MRSLGQLRLQLRTITASARVQAISGSFTSIKATSPAGLNSLADLSESKSASEHQQRAFSSNAACSSYHWESMRHQASTSNTLENEHRSRPSSRAPYSSSQRSADGCFSWALDARSRADWTPFDRGQSHRGASNIDFRSPGTRCQHTQARNEQHRDGQISPSQSDQPLVQPSPASQLQVGSFDHVQDLMVVTGKGFTCLSGDPGNGAKNLDPKKGLNECAAALSFSIGIYQSKFRQMIAAIECMFQTIRELCMARLDRSSPLPAACS